MITIANGMYLPLLDTGLASQLAFRLEVNANA